MACLSILIMCSLVVVKILYCEIKQIKKYVDKNGEIWYRLDTKTGCALEVGILGHV